MAVFIRSVLGLLTRIAVIVAAGIGASAAPSAAKGIAGGPARVGSTEIPHIFDIVADPTERDAVLLATRGGLYRARWDGTVERVSNARNPLWSLSVGGVGGSRLFGRGVADQGGASTVVVSDDRGRSWNAASPVGRGPTRPRLVEGAKADPDYIYAAGYSVWQSRDAGGSWLRRGRPPARILDIAASTNSAHRLFAATFSDLHVSDDGGLAWRPTGGDRCWQPVTAVDTGADGAVYAFSLCAGLVRGTDLAETWTVVNDRFGGCVVQHLAADPADSARVYAVIRCHRVLMSADGGATWHELGSPDPWEPSCPINAASGP